MTHAYSLSIGEDEGRFTLTVSDDGGDHTYEIHSCALEFYEDVQRELRPWYLEAESARAAVRSGVSLRDYLGAPQPVTSRPVSVEDAIEAGYALDDPKSPGWGDRMAEVID